MLRFIAFPSVAVSTALVTEGKKQDISPFSMHYLAHFNYFCRIKATDEGVRVGDWKGEQKSGTKFGTSEIASILSLDFYIRC